MDVEAFEVESILQLELMLVDEKTLSPLHLYSGSKLRDDKGRTVHSSASMKVLDHPEQCSTATVGVWKRKQM